MLASSSTSQMSRFCMASSSQIGSSFWHRTKSDPICRLIFPEKALIFRHSFESKLINDQTQRTAAPSHHSESGAGAGEVSVDALAKHFATSEVTIRKDLAVLETGGLLLRRYGGAVPLPSEMVVDSNPEQVSNRKLAIAGPPPSGSAITTASSSTAAAPAPAP